MSTHLLQIAKKLAHDAGQLALKYQEKGFKVQPKQNHFDLVTEVDQACEQLIIKTIKQNFPNHGILGEESGLDQGESDYKWIIDPIDGTSNFVHNLPIWAVSIAISYQGEPIIGVVEIPRLKETFWAQKNKGAYLNNQKIQVSQTTDLAKAMLATGFPYNRQSEAYQKSLAIFNYLSPRSLGIRRLGAASINLSFIAAGRFDGFWEYGLKAWDVAAGKIILEEAGGQITNLDGQTFTPKKQELLASNGKIHQTLLDSIKQFI